MKLSVIVPCLNAAKTIGTQLGALARQCRPKPWEVIVSDNGSTDDTRAVAERFKDEMTNLRIVDSSARPGVAHAYNIGALAATGDALAFCDADDEVGAGWLEAIGEALSKYDFVASRFEFEKLNTSWVRNLYSGAQSKQLQRLWYPPYLPHAGACGLGVKRTLHEAVGGFDESLPKLVDTDYVIRIQLTGTKLYFEPNAIVHIRFQTTYSSLFKQSLRWGENNVLLYKKYRPPDMNLVKPWKLYLNGWWLLMHSFPRRIVRKPSRAKWLFDLAWHIGRLQGSIKYRVPPV